MTTAAPRIPRILIVIAVLAVLAVFSIVDLLIAASTGVSPAAPIVWVWLSVAEPIRVAWDWIVATVSALLRAAGVA